MEVSAALEEGCAVWSWAEAAGCEADGAAGAASGLAVFSTGGEVRCAAAGFFVDRAEAWRGDGTGAGGAVSAGVSGGVSESMEFWRGWFSVGSGGSVCRLTGTGLGTESVGSEPAKTGMTTGVAAGLGVAVVSWGLVESAGDAVEFCGESAGALRGLSGRAVASAGSKRKKAQAVDRRILRSSLSRH